MKLKFKKATAKQSTLINDLFSNSTLNCNQGYGMILAISFPSLPIMYPFTLSLPRSHLLILLTVCHTILMMLVKKNGVLDQLIIPL